MAEISEPTISPAMPLNRKYRRACEDVKEARRRVAAAPSAEALQARQDRLAHVLSQRRNLFWEMVDDLLWQRCPDVLRTPFIRFDVHFFE
jgi:hypothetical protein